MNRSKILNRYIFSQVFAATLICIILFAIIWIAPETLLRTVQRVLAGTMPLKDGINVIVCEIPKIMANALPVGIFLGTLFTFDKLSKDSELTILRACGASFFKIISSIIILGIFTAYFTFVLHDRVIPFVETNYSIRAKDRHESSHFVFPIKNKNEEIQKIIIVPEYVDYTINDVVVLNFTDNSKKKGESLLDEIYMSDYVKFNEKENSWKMNEANAYKISKDGVYYDIGQAKNIEILRGERGRNAYELMKLSVKRDREMTNKEMKKYISLLKQESMDDEYRSILNKYLRRFSEMAVTVLFVVFGALLGFSRPREQRLIGFTVAVLTIFLYFITIPFLDLMAEKGVINPVITAFLAPIALVIAIFFTKKHKDL
jgi:lipopolysaccharide export LptBFGC system permease protein LptF